MAFNPTKEQQSAIDATGNVLVSAAAGSGKTAVLVERVITKLCNKENGISADKLLIVTFTNAAAAEMMKEIHAGIVQRSIWWLTVMMLAAIRPKKNACVNWVCSASK